MKALGVSLSVIIFFFVYLFSTCGWFFVSNQTQMNVGMIVCICINTIIGGAFASTACVKFFDWFISNLKES